MLLGPGSNFEMKLVLLLFAFLSAVFSLIPNPEENAGELFFVYPVL